MKYIRFNTWTEGIQNDPIVSTDPNGYRSWKSVAVQDGQEIESITVAHLGDRIFDVSFVFNRGGGAIPMEAGDLASINLIANIGDQDSWPYKDPKYDNIDIKEIGRLNQELMIDGQIDDLTLLVTYGEYPDEVTLWNITSWSSQFEYEIVSP